MIGSNNCTQNFSTTGHMTCDAIAETINCLTIAAFSLVFTIWGYDWINLPVMSISVDIFYRCIDGLTFAFLNSTHLF